jgi:N-acetylglutamate synthase-like GNAT family acetyltransferase
VDVMLRDARDEEAEALSALMMRAKASHGYDAAFMEACRLELLVTPTRIRRERVRVAERGGALVGVAALEWDDGACELTALFVDLVHARTGIGRALWLDALAECKRRGVGILQIASDPFAEGWYLKQGAVRIGDIPSGSIPARRLPLLQVVVR